MSDVSFSVKNNGVGRIRLESTDITGVGGPANPQLVLGLKFQLLQHPQTAYTLLRVNGKIYVGNETQPLASVEHPPMAEDSSSTVYERAAHLYVPLTLVQIKHIEDLRSGKDLLLRIVLSGLVILKHTNEFERFHDMKLSVI